MRVMHCHTSVFVAVHRSKIYTLLFSDNVLNLLTNNRSVLSDFVDIHYDVMNGTRKKAYLVVLLIDFTVLVFDAKVASVSAEIFTHYNNMDKMYAWNKFEEEGVVKDLVTQLGDLDKSQSLPRLESIRRNAQQSTLSGPPASTDKKPAATHQILKKPPPYLNTGTSQSTVAPREASVFGAIDMSNVNIKYDEMKSIETGGWMCSM